MLFRSFPSHDTCSNYVKLMNKIIGALVLAVVIVVLLYAGFTKVMTLSAENEILKQNVITLTQTNEQNLKAITDMKELSDKVDSLTLQ